MQIHSSSAHNIGKSEQFQHLSPIAQEALLSLKKIRNFGQEKASDIRDVKSITSNNIDNPQFILESNADQNEKYPPQNEFMGSQNFSFIQNSKSLLLKNSIQQDDPTPDFSDALLSSDRKQTSEIESNQLFFKNQLQQIQNQKIKHSQDIKQVQKGFIRKPTQEKENKQTTTSKQQLQSIRLSDLISKEIKKKISNQSQNNFRQHSQTSLYTHSTSQTKCNSPIQQDSPYQKSKFQSEKLKTFIDKGQIMNNKLEMKEGTFNRKINSKSKIINNSTFFDGQNTWIRKKNDKIAEQIEIQKNKSTKERSFSSNYRDNNNTRINSCDVYLRNIVWENKLSKKKQKLRNSMIDLNKNEKTNNISKMEIQRSNSAQLINKYPDFKQLLEIQIDSNVTKSFKSISPSHIITETTITPKSQCRHQELGKRKNSIEQVEQKYKILYDLVHDVNKNCFKKQK